MPGKLPNPQNGSSKFSDKVHGAFYSIADRVAGIEITRSEAHTETEEQYTRTVGFDTLHARFLRAGGID